MSQITEGTTIMVQGRIVWKTGDLFGGRPKLHYQTKQPVMDKSGVNPQIEYGFGLAIPKTHIAEIWQALHMEAYKIYTTQQLPPGFAFKFKDGDVDVDKNGKPYSEREGYVGNLVLALSSYIPIKFCKYDENARKNVQVSDGIKCGDYVNVQLTIKAHGPVNNGNPGLYLNPEQVQFVGYGKEIINAPSADDVFGTSAPVVPAGASAAPIAQAGMLAPAQAPVFNAGQAAQAPAPAAPVGQPAPQQMAPAQPHYGVIPPAHQPNAPGIAPAPQAPAMPPSTPGAAPAPQMPGMQQPSQMAQPAMPGMPQAGAQPPAAPAQAAAPVGQPQMPGVPVYPQQ